MRSFLKVGKLAYARHQQQIALLVSKELIRDVRDWIDPFLLIVLYSTTTG